MSDVSTVPAVVVPDLDRSPVCHLGCPDDESDPPTSICGVTRPALPDASQFPLCVVCADLSTLPCPTCGEFHVVTRPERRP